MPFFQHKCFRCSNTWDSKLARPVQCPKCKQPKWDIPARAKRTVEFKEKTTPLICSCLVCGNKWAARKADPKVCPACNSADWCGPSQRTMLNEFKTLWKKSCLSIDQFAARLGTTEDKLMPYIKGTKAITESQLAHIRSVVERGTFA